jgi:hypothetical protein
MYDVVDCKKLFIHRKDYLVKVITWNQKMLRKIGPFKPISLEEGVTKKRRVPPGSTPA